MKKKIAVIDVSSYIFRAFHALPLMTSPKGEPVNSIYGFISMFLKVATKFEGYSFAAALDSKTETFRKEHYAEYKANRAEVDPNLKCQFKHIERMLQALNIEIFSEDGFEADDIIASIAKNSKEYEVVIISSDKDLTQLINLDTVLYDGMKDKLIDRDAVFEKFGVYPEKMNEFLTLTGDSSDNIPGIPGVGPKTASKLLNEFGSIENIYNNLNELKPALKTKFEENKHLIELSRFLVTLKTDIAVDTSNLKKWDGINEEKFIELSTEFGFKSFLKRILSKSEQSEKPEEALEEITPWVDKSFELAAKETYFGAYLNNQFYLGRDGFFMTESLENIPANSTLYSFDIKSFFDYPFPSDIKIVDLQLAYFCHNSGRHSYTPAEIFKLIGYETELVENAEHFFDFLSKLKKRIDTLEERNFLIEKVEMPHLEVIRNMEMNGIKVDKEKLIALKEEFNQVLAELSLEIAKYGGSDFNPNSPKQLSEILFNKLNLPKGKKTKTGYSTDFNVLSNLAEMNIHPLPALIIKNREYFKLVTTYLEPILTLLDEDERLRTTFIVTHAATGRLASREPNLQNIPVRTDEGKKIRELFVAEKGNMLISLDYSQIELRILAALSKEPEFIEAFNNGEDIHKKTAAAIFQTIPEFVDDNMRRHAKAVNFGIIYGMQAYKLSIDTGVDIGFARKYIDNYFAYYPKIKNFIDTTIQHAREKGYAETLLKRRRYIPELASSNKNVAKAGERMAVNTVIQGSAADIIKTGTIAVHKMLKEKYPQAKILLQIHDELIIEAGSDYEEVAKDCAAELAKAGELIGVSLVVNYSAGKNWAMLK
ncbi:MAG: DNA polymerase [bacterium]